MATVQEKIDLMHAKKEKILQGGGQARIDKQHEKGKMTARERIEMFFDEGTFVELDMFVKHRCTNFGQEKKELPGEGVDLSTLSRKISRLRAVHSAKNTLIKFGKSWTWQ